MQNFEKNFHSQHIHFQDMSKGDFSMVDNSLENVFEEPVYINVIREPIARFISHFYYRRFNSGHKVLFPLWKSTFNGPYIGPHINEIVLT